ncbi:MAG: hypothetical protein V1799_11200 [bacterium]
MRTYRGGGFICDENKTDVGRADCPTNRAILREQITIEKNTIYYRRHLPHYQPLGASYHVVFRLKGLLPAEVFKRMGEEREELDRKFAEIKNEQDKRQ